MVTSDSNLITLEVEGGGTGGRGHSSLHSKLEASLAYIVSKENKQRCNRNNKNRKLGFLSWRSNPGHWGINLAVNCARSDPPHIFFARVILCKLGWSGTRNPPSPVFRNELSTTTQVRNRVLN